MAALIRQDNKRVRNQPEIKKERTHGEKEGEKREKTKHFLKRKRRQVMQIHVIRVHAGRATDARELPHTKKE